MKQDDLCTITNNVLNIASLTGCYAEFSPDGTAMVVVPDDENKVYQALSASVNLVSIGKSSIYGKLKTYYKNTYLIPNHSDTLTLTLYECFFPR